MSQLAEKVQQAGLRQQTGHSRTLLDELADKRVQGQLAAALPGSRGLTPERFIRVVMTEVRQNPQLLACTRESFLSCLMDSAALGLEPGPLGHAYLIPFRDNKKGVTECTLILGYKGLIDLARRSGEILSLKARAVYEQDFFEFEEGLEDRLVHRPNLSAEDPGQLTHAYAVARFKGGSYAFRVMARREIDAVRARSRSKDRGPWVDFFESMACKTVIRKMANSGELPLAIELATAIAMDERREYGLDQGVALDLPAPVQADATPSRAEDDAKPGEELTLDG